MNAHDPFDSLPPTPPVDAYQEEFQQPRRSSVFFSASDLEGQPIPPRSWLVDGLIPSGTVTLLGGDGGTGKSLLALQLAASVALSRAWLGLPTVSGGALYLSAEDDRDELHRRVADICRAEAATPADLDRLTLRSLAGEDALLAALSARGGALQASGLFRELDARLRDDAPALLVLDTLADLFPGDENNRAQARQFVGMLRGLAIQHDCAVVMLAHPSLSGLNSGSGTSGSTGWNNSVRSRLYLERVKDEGYEADPDARILRTMKANYSRTGGEISLKWRQGVFVADAPVTGIDRMAATAKAERVFLKLLRTFTDEGRTVNHAGGPSYAPTVFAKHPDAEKCTRQAFRSAMDKLLAQGKIGIEKQGSPSKTRQFLVLK